MNSFSDTSDLINQSKSSGTDQVSSSPAVVENGVAPPLPQRPPSRNKGILPQVGTRVIFSFLSICTGEMFNTEH